jgi:5-methylcytosine-specific restriction endonuclease McrA
MFLKDTTPNPDWATARLERLAVDGYACQAHRYGLTTDCTDKWLGLQVHHILPRGRGGRNTLDNLVTLCAGHHTWIESNRAAAKDLGLIQGAT